MISFDCPCGKPFRFSPKFCGRPFRCIACGRPLVVPEESSATLTDDLGETITPVKPVLQIDLDSLPVLSRGRVQNQGDESDEDEIIISGSTSKAGEESAFHVDIEPEEKDSTSVVLSKAAVAQQIKNKKKQEQAEAAPEPKPAKKGGFLSGFFKKKPKTTDATETEEPASASKAKEKPAKAPKEPKTPASKEEKPKKPGFLSGLFKKKPKTTDAAEGEVAKPTPAKKEPKTPAPKKEKVKNAGLLAGFFKKKPKAPKGTDATESD